MSQSLTSRRKMDYSIMEAYRDSTVPPNKKEEINQLPRWVKTALIFKAVDGMTYAEAAARVGRAGSTLQDYSKSPAAKKWLESVTEFVDDPVAMAKAYMSANALSITLERLAFLEAAVAAGDYQEGDKIARDLQDRLGIIGKKTDQTASTIVVNLGSASLEIPFGRSEAQELTEIAPGEYAQADE